MKRLPARITLAHVTRGLLYAAVLVVLAVAFTTSFSSGASGAQTLGYAPEFKASLPLVCDVIAAVATFMHAMARDDKPMRRTATWFVLVPMVLSWVANAIDHVGRAVDGSAGWTLAVVALAGLCPVAVAALLYLSTKFHEFEQRQAVKAEETRQRAERRAESTPKPRPQKDATPSAPAPKPAPAGEKLSPREWTVANWPTTGKKIQLATGVSKGYAYKLHGEVKAEMEAAS